MDPVSLLAPASPLGSPAPYWVLLALKVLGFTLHLGPMNLWLGGTILALLTAAFGGLHARKLSARLMSQMPLIISIGVNFGIVPLLFMQVAYYRAFYTATVLEAWLWLLVVLLLAAAYYGVYLYAIWLRTGNPALATVARAGGWVGAIFFIVIGFIFSHTMSLLVNVSAWEGIWKSTSVAGAALGTGTNLADPTLLPRYLMMFGLALITTAAYIGFDATVFARRETPEYRQWAGGFAWKLALLGSFCFAAFGSWYVFGSWNAELRQSVLSGAYGWLALLTAVAPALTVLALLLNRRAHSPLYAGGAVAAQFVVLALNAISRQRVQNLQLAPYLDAAGEQVNLQLAPLLLFLVLFVAGLWLTGWMIGKAWQASAKPLPQGAGPQAKKHHKGHAPSAGASSPRAR